MAKKMYAELGKCHLMMFKNNYRMFLLLSLLKTLTLTAATTVH